MSPARLARRPIEAVVFDYGLTLTTFRRPDAAIERAYAQIGELLTARLGRPVPGAEALVGAVHDAAEAEVAAHEATGRLEEIDIAGVHRRAYRGLGIDLPGDLLETVLLIEQRAWWEGVTVASDVPAVLTRLRRAGLRLGLCSNAPYPAAGVRAQIEHLGVGRLLDAITLSAEVGWRKPAPQMFAAALGALGAAAEVALMVGDRVREDVEGGAGAGMATVLLTEHRRDPAAPGGADAVLERLTGLPALLGLGRDP